MWHKGLGGVQVAGVLTLGTPLWVDGSQQTTEKEPLPVGGETKSFCPSSSTPTGLWVNHGVSCHLSHWVWGGRKAKRTERGLWGQADLAVNPGSSTH